MHETDKDLSALNKQGLSLVSRYRDAGKRQSCSLSFIVIIAKE